MKFQEILNLRYFNRAQGETFNKNPRAKFEQDFLRLPYHNAFLRFLANWTHSTFKNSCNYYFQTEWRYNYATQ